MRRGRNKELALDVPPLSLMSRYGLATAVWRAMQTMALVFWCSLFQCAAPLTGLTTVFVVVGVGLYGKSMWEAAFERSLDRLDEHTGSGTRTAFLLGTLQFLLVSTSSRLRLLVTLGSGLRIMGRGSIKRRSGWEDMF